MRLPLAALGISTASYVMLWAMPWLVHGVAVSIKPINSPMAVAGAAGAAGLGVGVLLPSPRPLQAGRSTPNLGPSSPFPQSSLFSNRQSSLSNLGSLGSNTPSFISAPQSQGLPLAQQEAARNRQMEMAARPMEPRRIPAPQSRNAPIRPWSDASGMAQGVQEQSSPQSQGMLRQRPVAVVQGVLRRPPLSRAQQDSRVVSQAANGNAHSNLGPVSVTRLPSQAQQANEAASGNAPQDSASRPSSQDINNGHVRPQWPHSQRSTLQEFFPSQPGPSGFRSRPSSSSLLSSQPGHLAKLEWNGQGGLRLAAGGSEPSPSQYAGPWAKPRERFMSVLSQVRKKLTPEPQSRKYWFEENGRLHDKNGVPVPSSYIDTVARDVKREWYAKKDSWIRWQLDATNNLVKQVHLVKSDLSDLLLRQTANYEAEGKIYHHTGMALPTSLSDAKQMGFYPPTFYTKVPVYLRYKIKRGGRTRVRLPQAGEPGYFQNNRRLGKIEIRNRIAAMLSSEPEVE
ncbi:hypothetical protein CDD82_1892 [Ophiocordyceps australis]|uniref:Uncharacterized protein n=1 Tax=Ophiocordyceps australis TaxID=1399860 RepID=A0A2C5Y7L5_9HYPO|nr:hypothetical protein CDD82_1892 [Ophiocordyceps australis]